MPAKGDRRKQDRRDKMAFAKLQNPPPQLYIHSKVECGCRVETLSVEMDVDRVILQVLHFDARNKLVWFSVLYNRMKDGRGSELYSVDTSHGHFHEHTTGHRQRGDRKDISPLYSQVNVQECFDTGYDLVHDKHLAMSGR